MRFQNPVLTDNLVHAVLKQRVMGVNSIHGFFHWIRVERNGLFLAQDTNVNLDVISYFALFHDSQRIHDGGDIGHGPRAAQFVKKMFYAGDLPVTRDELELLCNACEQHTEEAHHSDPVIQICWDADRLDLPRIGEQPDPDLLNTDKAKELAASGSLQLLEGYIHPGFQEQPLS